MLSNADCPSVPKRPAAGFSVWQPTQLKPVGMPRMSTGRPSERREPVMNARPAACSAVSELSRLRIGLGG
jgi:hypothetical protein